MMRVVECKLAKESKQTNKAFWSYVNSRRINNTGCPADPYEKVPHRTENIEKVGNIRKK